MLNPIASKILKSIPITALLLSTCPHLVHADSVCRLIDQDKATAAVMSAGQHLKALRKKVNGELRAAEATVHDSQYEGMRPALESASHFMASTSSVDLVNTLITEVAGKNSSDPSALLGFVLNSHQAMTAVRKEVVDLWRSLPRGGEKLDPMVLRAVLDTRDEISAFNKSAQDLFASYKCSSAPSVRVISPGNSSKLGQNAVPCETAGLGPTVSKQAEALSKTASQGAAVCEIADHKGGICSGEAPAVTESAPLSGANICENPPVIASSNVSPSLMSQSPEVIKSEAPAATAASQ